MHQERPHTPPLFARELLLALPLNQKIFRGRAAQKYAPWNAQLHLKISLAVDTIHAKVAVLDSLTAIPKDALLATFPGNRSVALYPPQC